MDSGSRIVIAPGRPEAAPSDAGSGDGGDGRIRCPLCRWEPRAEDRWMCTKCKYRWNTFDTGGVCPGCLKQWDRTMCLSCHKWSAHSDWYPKH
jgi:hypothetical protein